MRDQQHCTVVLVGPGGPVRKEGSDLGAVYLARAIGDSERIDDQQAGFMRFTREVATPCPPALVLARRSVRSRPIGVLWLACRLS